MEIKYLKKLLGIFILGILAIYYTHQRIMILQTGYEIEARKDIISALVDRNQSLLYNLTKLETPAVLEEKFYVLNPLFKRGTEVRIVRLEKEEIKERQDTVEQRNISYASE